MWRNKPFLALLVAHVGWGFGHTICFAWLPNFYYSEYGLAVQDSSTLSALPWFGSVVVTYAGIASADWLVSTKRTTRVQARKACQLLGSWGPALCLLGLAVAAMPQGPDLPLRGAVTLVTLCLALGGLCASGYASNHQDLSTKYPAILFGITNSASSLTGTASTYSAGLVLDATASWSVVFLVIAVVYCLSSLLYAFWASADNQFDTPEALARADQLRGIPR